MKKFTYLLMFLCLTFSICLRAQENTYNMVIEMTNGTKISIGPNDVRNVTFNDGKLVVTGEDLQSWISNILSDLETVESNMIFINNQTNNLNNNVESMLVTIKALSGQVDYLAGRVAKLEEGQGGQEEPVNIAVTTGTAKDITATEVTISDNSVNGAPSSITVGIIYGTSSSLSETNGQKESTVSSGSYSVSLSNLNSETTYYYRAYALYNGKYYYGDTKSFNTIKATTGVLNGHEWVDLGLPSGTKWATCNIGASSPEDFGCHYAWGETSEKTYYSWSAYQYGNSMNDVMNIGSDISGTNYDVASLKWGNPWCMPSLNQIKELLNCCSKEKTMINNVKGYRLVGPNGLSIFLPEAGYCDGSIHGGKNVYGKYWSSTVNDSSPRYAYTLYFASGGIDWSGNLNERYYGLSIRPVCNI